MKRFGSSGPRCVNLQRAFSLVELLVVLAIVAVLASLILPGLAHAKSKAQGIQCLGNGRQLLLGWLMYADDHDGVLCPNGPAPGQAWVRGVMNFEYNFSDNTNASYLSDPQLAKLGAYIRSSAVYHCPSDRSQVRNDGRSYLRVRSVAMNDSVGSAAERLALPGSDSWRIYRKMNEVVAPTPASLWVVIEQHPDSINDARFTVDCQSRNASARLVDFPASFHDRASSVSFADGHAEIHRWLSEATRPPLKYCGCLSHYAAEGYFVNDPNSPDLAWLQDRTSAPRN